VLLRASGEVKGSTVDLRAITDPTGAAGSGIDHAPELIRFAEAAHSGEPLALAAARAALRQALGSAALVDTAAVVGNFERMTRIADATGIALDAPVLLASDDFREALGLDDFRSADNTPAPGALQRLLGPMLRPLIRRSFRLLDGIARRGSS